MFFQTIQTLIDHHNVKSVNVTIAKDKVSLYALINLALDTEKVKNESVISACSTPFIIRDTGNGIDEDAEILIEKIYQSAVSVDELDANKTIETISASGKKGGAKPKPVKQDAPALSNNDSGLGDIFSEAVEL